ncbi:MAG: hypothetical protein JW940_12715, partial [Polyangiaceae bacterium]|nr:hypothetical protein [Polyangiaceae bacterium]
PRLLRCDHPRWRTRIDATRHDRLRQPPRCFKDDVLAPSRAAAFRRGELDLTRFVDTTGRRYTLEELAKRDGVEIPLRRRPEEELSKDLVLRGDPRRKDWDVAGPRHSR